MKIEKNKQPVMVKVPEKVLLSLVAAKFRGKIFFPEKVERARKYLENVKSISF